MVIQLLFTYKKLANSLQPLNEDHYPFQPLPPLWSAVRRSGRHLIPPLQWRKTKIDGQWPTTRTQVTPKQTTSRSCPATGDRPPQLTWPWTKAEHAQKAASSFYSNNSTNLKIFNYWYIHKCQKENILILNPTPQPKILWFLSMTWTYENREFFPFWFWWCDKKCICC